MCMVTLKYTPSKKTGTTDNAVHSLKVYIGSRAPHSRTVLKNGQDKPHNASPKKQSIMEYLPGLPKDTKPLESCSGNRAKMFFKSHLGIKCHSQYNKVIRLLQHSSANS